MVPLAIAIPRRVISTNSPPPPAIPGVTAGVAEIYRTELSFSRGEIFPWLTESGAAIPAQSVEALKRGFAQTRRLTRLLTRAALSEVDEALAGARGTRTRNGH